MAELELGADPLLDRVQPTLLQVADLRLHAVLEREICERLAAPEGERLRQRRSALGRCLGPRLLAEPVELGEVELLRARCDHIPRRAPRDRLPSEQPAQL